ncbi:hypothetical protein BITS_0917 [Bifidobacterium tsurumiense]|uniref:ECF transporter S component n=2 Tax=Bifidobacterium tsurumiense TaxID=356829 RepID=A0A087EE61_9BIFI|nr:hypothetical protein BITS_0917 [Bifidobacterium tsurumiense]
MAPCFACDERNLAISVILEYRWKGKFQGRCNSLLAVTEVGHIHFCSPRAVQTADTGVSPEPTVTVRMKETEPAMGEFQHASNQGHTSPDISSDANESIPIDSASAQSVSSSENHNSMPKNRRRPSALQAHSTGVADSGRWSSRRIAVYALFVALTAATSFIEVPLLVPWLKYDPSGIIALVAGFAFGPSAAGIVSVLSFTPHLFTNPLGAIMGMAVGLALTVPAALIYQRFRTRKGALFALIIGSICAIVIAIAGNLVITPIYTGMTVAQVAALIVPVLLPFNVLKMFLHIVCTFIIYKPISDLLHR